MHSMLMITSILGADNCAAALANQLGLPVETAGSRKEGLARLRRREYTIVVVDDAIADSDPEGAELLWKHAGLAIPLQLNFAISGTTRLAREVRAVLAHIRPPYRLMVELIYGSGLRLLECLRLRVKDIDFDYGRITSRDGKGMKDRVTMLSG